MSKIGVIILETLPPTVLQSLSTSHRRRSLANCVSADHDIKFEGVQVLRTNSSMNILMMIGACEVPGSNFHTVLSYVYRRRLRPCTKFTN
jgi:hypothetical protein